jgi:hypothetical protein
MMSEAEFFAGLTGSPNDLALTVKALKASGQPFCLIGGLAVNHYSEPMVTLDANFAITNADGAVEALKSVGFIVEEFAHSINATLPGSRLRIQITVNGRYAAFPLHAEMTTLFGVEMPVAALEDVVQGKVWAATDPARRKSKRAKDEADLIRLAEVHLVVFDLVPPGLVPALDEIRPRKQTAS